MKVAIIHEWLTSYAGSEKVLEQILKIFPDAELYAVVDFLPENQRDFIMHKNVHTTFIQNLPKARTSFRKYLALMPLAIEQFDLRKFDLVISNSHCVAKGVIVGPDQLHISYVNSPIRYAWDMQNEYLAGEGITKGVKSWIVKIILHYMRIWDSHTANGVDYLIGNSRYITRRIKKCYRREADCIYPPVDINGFSMKEDKEDFYITASRNVPYKKMDIIVKAFKSLPNKKLVVIGHDTEKLAKFAGSNVTILGQQPFEVLRDHLQRAKGFIFAAEEDFGIAPLEAQACGTPVIAFGRGGAVETVRGLEQSSPTGLFFSEQTSESIVNAINSFEEKIDAFTPYNCRANAECFSEENFRIKFKNFVENKINTTTRTEAK